MKHSSETIADDNGIEILVGYDYEKTPAYYEEVNNPSTLVEETVYTDLKTVEVVIAGIGVDILPLMTEKQKVHLINKLQYKA